MGMASIRAQLSHHFQSTKGFIAKQVWRTRIFPAMWPLIAMMLRVLAIRSQEVNPSNCAKDRAIVLMGTEDSFRTGRVQGQDLTGLAGLWLTETLGFKELQLTKSLTGLSQNDCPDVVLITYDWLLENQKHLFQSALSVSRQLRKLQAPALVILPDGFWLPITAMGSLIVALAGGSQIILQDSVKSHKRFGTIRPTGPHFWTWPPSKLDFWKSGKAWSDRQKVALIAGTGGGPYREWVAEKIGPKLNSAGYQIQNSNYKLGWNQYVKFHGESQIVVTTCNLQPEYAVGPRYYQRLLPDSTVTGRVWEAFSSENLLITDPNSILEGLGFLPGVHYLALPNPTEISWSDWRLPSEVTLAKIARQGHQHFRNCVESERVVS